MRTLIIHNTAAGSGSDGIFAFQRALIEPGDEVVMRTFGPNRTVNDLVRDVAAFDAVVASGGDGTIAAVAYAVRGSDVPVLIFPSGTANLFANNIGNAIDPPALAKTLRTGKRVKLDICEFEYRDASGVLQRRGFLNMAGAGYDASIMQGSTNLKAVFGQLSYYLAALGNLDPGVSHLRLTIDGKPIEANGICVMVANWASVNQAIEFIPRSSPVDGLLDIAVMAAKNSVELIPAVFGSVFSHGNENAYPNIAFYHAHEVSVVCEPAFRMQYDGEVVTDATTPFTARVIPGGLCTVIDSLSPLATIAKGLSLS